MKWAQVVTETFWTSPGGDSGGSKTETHTIKVNPNCVDLKKQCELKLKQKRINFNRIVSYKFV